MANAPLYLVIATVVLLTLFGRWLARLQLKPVMVSAAAVSAPSRGVELVPGVDVIGPQQRRVEELRSLIRRGREEPLAGFLAYFRPALVQIDLYLARLRESYYSAIHKPFDLASTAERQRALRQLDLSGAPADLDLARLDPEELRVLLEAHWGDDHAITRKLVERLGGWDHFMENFHTYTDVLAAELHTCFIPPHHPRRRWFDMLEESGMAARGKSIPLAQRLTVLEFDELQILAEKLKLPPVKGGRQQWAEALAAVPASAQQLAIHYDTEQLFCLLPVGIDTRAVLSEWRALSAYARLLLQFRERIN